MEEKNVDVGRKPENSTDDNAKAEEKPPPKVESADDTCVVCFKNVDIYSIGECDHPVCYECSTRMRVLCQQNECPICRQVLSKVIFTHDKLPYRELEAKNRSEYYNKRYKIGFYDYKIQQSFYELLDHCCPKCQTPPYRTFQGLKNHVRKEHNLHYCDLCTDHLKIFTFERRCYTQAELGLHRTKGDADNRSHRGHPLCEYCNKRYLDRDELFRHLRREHYYCHFCEADGVNEFYRDYDALAEHFRQDHYLCEEGKCASEQFIAFRTDIDFKAHIAKEHGKSLNKQQAKQTRTLQLEITLGRRGRTGQPEPNIASVRSRGYEDEIDDMEEPSTSHIAQQNQRPIMIDAQNEQDFPSLGGNGAVSNLSLTRAPPLSMRNRSAIAGLARTKENFPALCGGSGGANGYERTSNQQPPPISKVLRNTTTSNTGAVPRTPPASVNVNSGMVIHVSNRPAQSATNGAKKSNQLDFPALPSTKNKKGARALDEDMLPSGAPVPMANVSAKHRTLVDDYVSVALPNSFQKIQMVQKEQPETKTRKQTGDTAGVPKLKPEDFPSLLGTISKPPVATTNTWTKTVNERKQRELENRKSKVAPPPLLPNNNKTVNRQTSVNNNVMQNNQTKKEKEKKPKDKKSTVEVNTKTSTKSKEKNNNEIKNVGPHPKQSPVDLVTKMNGENANGQSTRPPPGFATQGTVNAPPGFLSNVTVNSVAKSPNDLTFTSSLGEKYSIMTTHTYTQPTGATTRNQQLVENFKDVLKTKEALEEFRLVSQLFREGIYKSDAYYEHCQAALKDKFNQTFPELLALLPDISKQQALYLVHSQHMNNMPAQQRKLLPKLEVCGTCKQVLLHSDVTSHREYHNLKDNFPTLSSKPTKSATAARK